MVGGILPKIIGIVSGKGGVGKTVTALNLGLALTQFGEKVIVVDADITASNLGLHLGYYSFPNSLQEVLKGNVDIGKAKIMHHTGLNIIPSAIDLQSIDTNVTRLRSVLQNLPYDYVIVDAPPGLNDDSMDVIKACDELIIVTNPEVPTVTNAVKVARIAEKFRKTLLGVVINRVGATPYELTPGEVEMMIEAPIIGVIPEDHNIKESIFNKTPVVAHSPFCDASINYKRIAARLLGKTYEPPRFLRLRRLFGRI